MGGSRGRQPAGTGAQKAGGLGSVAELCGLQLRFEVVPPERVTLLDPEPVWEGGRGSGGARTPLSAKTTTRQREVLRGSLSRGWSPGPGLPAPLKLCSGSALGRGRDEGLEDHLESHGFTEDFPP